VRSFGGEKRQMFTFAKQVLSFLSSGIKLGTFKSFNESMTRVAIYISLISLYCLRGNKVKAVSSSNLFKISIFPFIFLSHCFFCNKFNH
ncbi:hypothetical protein HN51_050708, partial [Arachis hypogaea]